MDEVYTGLDSAVQGTSAKRHGSRAGGAAVRRKPLAGPCGRAKKEEAAAAHGGAK